MTPPIPLPRPSTSSAGWCSPPPWRTTTASWPDCTPRPSCLSCSIAWSRRRRCSQRWRSSPRARRPRNGSTSARQPRPPPNAGRSGRGAHRARSVEKPVKSARGRHLRIGDARALGMLHYFIGDWDEAERCARRAVEIGERANRPTDGFSSCCCWPPAACSDDAAQQVGALEALGEHGDAEYSLDLSRAVLLGLETFRARRPTSPAGWRGQSSRPKGSSPPHSGARGLWPSRAPWPPAMSTKRGRSSPWSRRCRRVTLRGTSGPSTPLGRALCPPGRRCRGRSRSRVLDPHVP